MYCKFCGSRIEDDSLFCGRCGAKISASDDGTSMTKSEVYAENNACDGENTVAVENSSVLDGKDTIVQGGFNPPPVPVGTSYNDRDEKVKKPSKIVKVILFVGYMLGLAGVVTFLILSIVGAVEWGDVLLFGDTGFTVCSAIAMALVAIGACCVFVRLATSLKHKDKIASLCTKRILLVVLCVACIATFTWGFVDLGHGYVYNSGTYGGSGTNTPTNSNAVDFYDVYVSCGCTSPWAKYGNDYISVDTNPYDYDDGNSGATKYMVVAVSAIRKINAKLGIPDYVYDLMLETRALDGRQTYSGTKVDVSWTYHPDQGLQVTYMRKSS